MLGWQDVLAGARRGGGKGLWPAAQAGYDTNRSQITIVNILSLNKHPVQQYLIFSVYNLSLLQRFSYQKKEQKCPEDSTLFAPIKLLIVNIVLFCFVSQHSKM